MVMGTEAHNLRALMSGFKYDLDIALGGRAPAPESFLDPNAGLDAELDPFLDVADGLRRSASPGGEQHEDGEGFSDMVLSYISRMLMEEDIDDKLDMYQEPAAILAAEKPFYEILTQNSNLSPNSYSSDSPGGNGGAGSSSSSTCSSGGSHPFSLDCSSQSSLGGSSISFEGFEDHLASAAMAPSLDLESLPAWQFMKGVEEARKFLPSEDKLVIDLEAIGFSLSPEAKESTLVKVEAEQQEKENHLVNGLRIRKKPHAEDLDLEEGRSVKQLAIYPEETVRTEMFDEVLLCGDLRCGENGNVIQEVVQIREAAQKEAAKSLQNSHPKGSGSGKGRGKKQSKKEVVDLRTLLIHCAQMVAADDRRSATELLKQIRQHSSPIGDGSQRLAHCFADGLEARLAGTGSQVYHSLIAKRKSASDVLKAFQLYLAACPFKRISLFCANMTILNAAEKAKKVHIIDFGIYYGFQWPCFIQRLSKRAGGPPKLRITGIDVPQPGFRPKERIEETGHRLSDYAQSFGVPFEYHAIASHWEAVRVEDLNIRKDELLIVNCLHRLQNVMDETISVDSPRDMVLKTIKKINPEIFVLGVSNGSYNAPFFVTRFREALFHFSALFDMLETNVPREHSQRMLIERELFGREALNVISCEGSERVERPETYKQWLARTLRAGFEQVPLNPDIMRRARDKVRGSYHKDFIIDEYHRWLLQGWKGRITHGLSIWKPAKIH